MLDADNMEVPFRPHPYSGPCNGAVHPQSTLEALSKALLYVVVVGKVSKDSGRKSKATEEARREGQRTEISECGLSCQLPPRHAHTESAWPSSPQVI